MEAVLRSLAGVKLSPSTGKKSGVPSSAPVWNTALQLPLLIEQESILYPSAAFLSQSVAPNLNVQGMGFPLASSISLPTLPQKYAMVVSGHCSPFGP